MKKVKLSGYFNHYVLSHYYRLCETSVSRDLQPRGGFIWVATVTDSAAEPSHGGDLLYCQFHCCGSLRGYYSESPPPLVREREFERIRPKAHN